LDINEKALPRDETRGGAFSCGCLKHSINDYEKSIVYPQLACQSFDPVEVFLFCD